MMLKNKTILIKGQTAIELLIGATILSMVFIGILTLTIRSLQLAEVSANRQRAIFLAKEGIENARQKRTTSNWSTFYDLANSLGNTYNTNQFTNKQNTKFDRTITLTVEADDKVLVTSVVTWTDIKGTHTITEETYLTKW